ncbi:MAG: hypothetical protein ACRD5F_01570 [Candidatus Acidiferrales bacterium]
MLAAPNLFRLVQEFVFILLGGLLMVIAASGRYFPDRRGAGWLVLAAIMVIWGMRAGWRPLTTRAGSKAGRNSLLRSDRLGGGSLILVGGLMLVIAWAPFDWVRPLLAAAGAVLALRGIASAAMVLRH